MGHEALKIAKWLNECSKSERDKYIAEKVMEVRKRYKQILIEVLLK